MEITLLGLEFTIKNRGCEALAYSFVNILNSVAKEIGIELHYTAIVISASPVPLIHEDDPVIDCMKIQYGDRTFWREAKNQFAASDLIVDFTMGDSFADIYGFKRFALATHLKGLAIASKKPFVLGPQTYGPYNNRVVRRWAARIIRKSNIVYARDEISRSYAYKLSHREIKLTTDVAFSLPYKHDFDHEDGLIHVGINPSGLLWNGGYTSNNQFNLTVDYREYCWRLIDYLMENPIYKVHAISHVGYGNGKEIENDHRPCLEMQEKYPAIEVIPKFDTAMDIKSYISSMDIFIGARMHATIGAFSSGVATIPFSYSRKFEGLYNSLDYDYVIHAQSMSTDDAVETTIKYIDNYKKLEANVSSSMQIVQAKQAEFSEDLKILLLSINK